MLSDLTAFADKTGTPEEIDGDKPTAPSVDAPAATPGINFPNPAKIAQDVINRAMGPINSVIDGAKGTLTGVSNTLKAGLETVADNIHKDLDKVGNRIKGEVEAAGKAFTRQCG